MFRSTSRSQCMLVSAVVFTSSVLCPMASPAAPESSWDQKRVTEIAKKIASDVDKLYRAELRAPAESYLPELGNADFYQNFMDTLRRLQHETRHLASALEKGAGRAATTGSVEHIVRLNHELVEYGRGMEFMNPAAEEINSYDELLGQLAPYYELDEKHDDSDKKHDESDKKHGHE
jgi:hypothetical protein